MEMLGARVHFSIGSFEAVPGEPLMLELVPLCALTTRRSAVISRHVSLVHWLIVNEGFVATTSPPENGELMDFELSSCELVNLGTTGNHCELMRCVQSLSLIQVNHTYACHNSELLTKDAM